MSDKFFLKQRTSEEMAQYFALKLNNRLNEIADLKQQLEAAKKERDRNHQETLDAINEANHYCKPMECGHAYANFGFKQEDECFFCFQLQAAKVALEFYANVENWHRYKDGKRVYEHGHPEIPQSRAMMDYGKIAGKTIQQLAHDGQRDSEG